MKKALAAIVLATACLVPVGISATTTAASAATCETTPRAKAGSVSFTPDPSDGNNPGTWLITTRVDWTRCTTGYGAYAKNITVRFFIDKQQGICGAVDLWRGNPDILGGWNPGTKDSNWVCANPVIAWYGPGALQVYSTDTYDNRCLGGSVTAVGQYMPNGSATKALPQVCII